MTIKKRLVISNILMVAIPAVVSLVVAGLGFLFFYVMYNDMLMEWIKAEREMSEYLPIAAYEGLLIGLSLIGLAAIMFLTNRLLIKFVFKKVEQPLDLLSDGVHQISDGNLDLKLYSDLPVQERLELFLCQIGNPYCFKVNGTPVQVAFSGNRKTLDEALNNYLTNLKDYDRM